MSVRIATLVIGFALVGCDAEQAADPVVGSAGGQTSKPAGGQARGPTSRGVSSQPTARVDNWLLATEWHLSGEGVHQGPAIEVADVLAALLANANKTLRIAGPIHAVGPERRWVRIGTAAANLYVQPASAAFALPDQAVGRRAVCEGQLSVALAAPGAAGAGKQVASLIATGLAVER